MKVARLARILEDLDQNLDVLVRTDSEFCTVGQPSLAVVDDGEGHQSFAYFLPLAETIGEATDRSEVDDWLRAKGHHL